MNASDILPAPICAVAELVARRRSCGGQTLAAGAPSKCLESYSLHAAHTGASTGASARASQSGRSRVARDSSARSATCSRLTNQRRIVAGSRPAALDGGMSRCLLTRSTA